MSKITKETVEHIAKLASLKFSEEQLEVYTRKFVRVLEYVEELNKLDTKKVEPMSHAGVSETTKMREDMVIKFEDVDKILETAPAKDDRFIEVPIVIT